MTATDQEIRAARAIASRFHDNPKGVIAGNHDTSAIVGAAVAAVVEVSKGALAIVDIYNDCGPETYEVRSVARALKEGDHLKEIEA